MFDFSSRFLELRRRVIQKDLSRLNPTQLRAACTVKGPLLILAGAGSGKTTVLINRIVNILKYGSGFQCQTVPDDAEESDLELMQQYINDKSALSPEQTERCIRLCSEEPAAPGEILAITFTNKAANELKERLTAALGEEQANGIWAYTFHAACIRILRRSIENLGYRSTFTIYDEDDKKKVIQEILAEMNLQENRFDPRFIGGEISRAKDSLISPKEYLLEYSADFLKKTIGEIYSRYEKRLFTANALDFDDIIVKTVDLFLRFPKVLEYYQDKFKYILIDEYQDTNHAQYELTRLLASKNYNICAVGDDDQGIYKFRGASIENILNFEKNFINAEILRLEQNYRSTQRILDAAGGVISHNKGRKGKTLWTENGNGEQVCFITAGTEEGEAFEISYRILKACENGAKMSDFAVLYRNNVLSQPIEMSFKRNGIPYRIVSGKGFFERAEVKDMLSYLWVISNPHDNLRLKRIINNPARKISEKTVELLENFASESNSSLFKIALNVNIYPDLSRASAALQSFTDIIMELRTAAKELPLPEFYKKVTERTGYIAALEAKSDETSKKRIENVKEIESLIVDYCSKNEEPSLEGFLEQIALFTSIDRYDDTADAVSLMTIHSAKGLEFENVFVCGMEDNIFPGFKASENPQDLEEERRLCYVAMTRAKKHLYLTCALRRMMYGQTKHSNPSRFIAEIPEQCLFRDSANMKASLSPANSSRFVTDDYSTMSSPKNSPFIPAKQSSFISGDVPPGRSVSLQSRTSHMFKGMPSAKPKTPAEKVSYVIGDEVEHRAFGKGLITMATPIAGDILLEIAFDKVGTKKLMANSASQFMKKL